MSVDRSQDKKKKKHYWFPAKKYGWGWGFPNSWQGILVFFVFIVSVITLPFIVSPAENLSLFILISLIPATLLMAICYWKGEPPQWRWGNKDSHDSSP